MYNNPDFFIFILFFYFILGYAQHQRRSLLIWSSYVSVAQTQTTPWQSAVTRENVFSNWFASGCQLSVTKGAAQEPHDYFGLADCSALIGSAAPDLPCCNIDVAAGLKPRVYDCIGFYCHLKEILGQRLRDMQIQRGRSCDSLQSVFPQVSCFQSLCLQFCLSGDTYGSGEQAHTFLQRSPSSLLLKTFEGLPIRRKWF